MPKPARSGTSVTVRARSTSPASCTGDRVPGARRPGQRDQGRAIRPSARPPARIRSVGVVGATSWMRGKLRRRFEREVGDDEARRAGGRRVVPEALVPVGLQERGVRHRDERDVDPRPRLGEALEAGLGAHALGDSALAGQSDHRSVRERIREREADLEDVCASRDRGRGATRASSCPPSGRWRPASSPRARSRGPCPRGPTARPG